MSAGDLVWAGVGERPEARDALFERVVREHERAVLRVCYRLLGNLADAQDVAQEVFLRVYRHRAELEETRSPSAWLYRVAVNACRDRQRRQKVTVAVEDAGLEAGGSVEAEAAAKEMQRYLMMGLATLPEKERQALVLRDLEGLSAAEAAEILGSTEGTVRSQASVARAKLRIWFDERLGRRA